MAINQADKTIMGCYDKGSVEVLASLMNLQIINVTSLSEYIFDPVFIVEDGSVLEIFSSSTSEEIWTLHFKDDNVFIVSFED